MRRIVDVVNLWPVNTATLEVPQPNSPEPKTIDDVKTITAKPSAKVRRLWLRKVTVLYSLAGLLVAAGAYLAISGYLTNRQLAAQIGRLSDQTASADTGPSTTPPSADAVKNYKVAPNLPKYIDIPGLSVHARVMSMGVDDKNVLQAPSNVYDTGWYNASAQPGQPGGMLIDGHISSWSTKGVFYGLNKLKTGDTITITRGDNRQFTYRVVSSQIKPVDQVDMSSLLVSADVNKPGLSLISCSGEVIPGTNEYDKRIMIQAVLVN
jgi:LPXTG-site transpeptidase (sortase) family protein